MLSLPKNYEMVATFIIHFYVQKEIKMAYDYAIFHNFYPCNFKAQFSEFSWPNFSKALIILSLTANRNYSTTGLTGFFLKCCSVLISSPRTCEPASAVQTAQTTLAATASQTAQKALAAQTALTTQTALTSQTALAGQKAMTAQKALAGQKPMTDQTAPAAQTTPEDQRALVDQTASASQTVQTALLAQTDSADQTALLAQKAYSAQTTLAASGEPASANLTASAAQTASADQTVLATQTAQTASAASGLPQLHQNAQLDSTSYPAFHSAQTEYHSQSNVQHIEPFYRYRVYSDAS